MTRQIGSAIALALASVARNKLRAGLTILGILIGVAAVVVTAALGTGARGRIDEQIEKLGSNVAMVFPQANQASGARGAQGSGARLTEDDAKAILRDTTSVAASAPFLGTNAQVVYDDRNVETHIIGTTRAYLTVRNWGLKSGDSWGESAEAVGERVVLLGSTTATNLFGNLDPVGRTVRVGRHPYRVVGLLESKGQSPFGSDQDDVVLLPIATFRSHLTPFGVKGVHGILFSANSADTGEHAKAQAESILRQRHHIVGAREPDFVIRTQAEFRASQDAIYGALSTLLLAVGAVSLFVGGLGIMNIMLVSVAERTREIGIRMAIGARENDILLQFLVEALVLSLLGGLAGTVVAVALVITGRGVVDWPMRLEPQALLIALVTSSAIGIVFGIFPARKAARLDPVLALGRE